MGLTLPQAPGVIAKEWHKLEGAAGVSHVHDRNWYGMRRRLTDLGADTATELGIFDRRVLDSITGDIEWACERISTRRSGVEKYWNSLDRSTISLGGRTVGLQRRDPVTAESYPNLAQNWWAGARAEKEESA